MDDVEPDPKQLQERVLFALLLPAARLARRFGVSLRRMSGLFELAYFHEARAAGLRLQDVAALFDISPRKAAQLSTQLKRNFLSAQQAVGVPRRIEFMLWARPLSRARIVQVLPDLTEEDIDRALDQLVCEERVALRRQGRVDVYERLRENSRLVSGRWQARLDALENLAVNLSATVYARFFRGDEKAVARTINFLMRPEDLGEIRELYERIWQRITELESKARDEPQALEMAMTVFWAPNQRLDERKRRPQ